MKKLLLILSGVLILAFYGMSQNVSVSDDTLYNPESSAMLDVHSESKGFLVPRLTQAHISGISDPATGLLVFNTDNNKFNYYTGSEWIVLNAGNPDGLWATKEDTLVYLNDSLAHFGIGTYTPSGKLEVRADQSIGDDDPLFEVKNHAGEPVFAVYPNGVRVFTDEGSKGSIGGFAVSGRSATKDVSDYFQVTPDSVRVYVKESGKGNIGGFAVSGRNAAKAPFDEFLRVTPDSTRVYVNENAKGNIGGFAVSGRSATKGTTTKFMDITRENYAIGHESGSNLSTGQYNNFLGYQAGMETNEGVMGKGKTTILTYKIRKKF